MTVNFAELTAQEIVTGIQNRRFTARDVIESLAGIIETKEPEVQAWSYYNRDQALSQAADIDAKLADAPLPLRGVPIALKDIIDTADMPTENGTVLDAGRQPSQDAEVAGRLREAGAVIMGKAVTTELAFLTPSKTRNPRNPAHTPGGSSAGSAAAVGAGMVPVALGSQTNGSVIRPASFCGIYALKPTNGLFPRNGVLEESAVLDTVGIFARSLDDLALVSNVLAGRTVIEKVAVPANAPRLAFIKTPAWPHAEEVTKQAFTKLHSDLDPHCEELTLSPAFDEAVNIHRTIMLADIARNYAGYYERGKDRLDGRIVTAIENGRAITAGDYENAIAARDDLYRRFEAEIEGCDAVITPPAAGPAPLGFETTGNPIFCTLWTLLATPALNLPLLTANGLPLGVQLAGRRNDEARLFGAARWLCNTLYSTDRGKLSIES